MINLIPMPANIRQGEGEYILPENPTVYVVERLSRMKAMLESTLKIKARYQSEGQISFLFASMKPGSYSLSVNAKGIQVYAPDYEGAFYAMQSLRQLFGCDWAAVKKCRFTEIIDDCAEYSWRGLHLDESRHFFGKEIVKKYLDFMALYKLNRFHWHLTDDQGWRIEIEKYPRLTEIGSKRRGSQLHSWKCHEVDFTPYGGYYTKDDIREIIDYAAERYIEIVPEIDFPAHTAAAIAAYNDIACRNLDREVHYYCGGLIPAKEGIKDWNRPICLGSDEVLSFAFDVIDEVAELFPFEYFHVGGDEAPRDEWKKCPRCQERIRKEGLKDETALQGWFTNQLNAHLKEKGKIMIGWNEVLAADIVDRDVVAQYWTPQKDQNVLTHLNNGGKVILSWHKYFYFDMLHTYCTPKGTYGFTAATAGVKDELKKNVLGVEGEVWTEWIADEDHLFFNIASRMPALAECGWSKDSVKNYSSFARRLKAQHKIMDAMGIYYGDDAITMKKDPLRKKYMAKKNGSSIGYFDCEYTLSKLKTDKK